MGRHTPIDTALLSPPAMIRIEQAVARLGISRATLYRRAKDGTFRIVKRGGASYVPTEQVEQYLNPDYQTN